MYFLSGSSKKRRVEFFIWAMMLFIEILIWVYLGYKVIIFQYF